MGTVLLNGTRMGRNGKAEPHSMSQSSQVVYFEHQRLLRRVHHCQHTTLRTSAHG